MCPTDEPARIRPSGRLPDGALVATATAVDGPAFVTFRPNAVVLDRQRPHGSARNVWPGEAVELHIAGDRVRVAAPVALVAEVTAAVVTELHLGDGGRVWASVKATDVDVYPAWPAARATRAPARAAA
jgi:molybdate transport system ATP-binding protein